MYAGAVLPVVRPITAVSVGCPVVGPHTSLATSLRVSIDVASAVARWGGSAGEMKTNAVLMTSEAAGVRWCEQGRWCRAGRECGCLGGIVCDRGQPLGPASLARPLRRARQRRIAQSETAAHIFPFNLATSLRTSIDVGECSHEGGGEWAGTVTSVNKRGRVGRWQRVGSWGAKRVLARKGDTEREGATRGNHSRPSRLREEGRGLERKQRGGRMKKGRPALSFAREGDVEQERVPESPVCGRVACRSGETTQWRMVMARTNEKWRWWGCGVGIVGRRRDWWNGTAVGGEIERKTGEEDSGGVEGTACVVVIRKMLTHLAWKKPEPSSLSFAIVLVSVGVGEPNVMVAFCAGGGGGGWVVGSSRSGGGCGTGRAAGGWGAGEDEGG
ncbi:hypothetical protein BD779DRAFT_1787432 [Infundibulicybe gibba]|nr:hypothetical protein BD779DRAFT_1787432 [Infundibulicybe gibba]